MSSKHQGGATSISCEVALGMFRDERGVEIKLPDGRIIVALVDKRDVQVTREPQPGEKVPGYLRVSVIEQQDDDVLVDLPQPSFSSGQRFRVPRALLEGSPA